ncbi:MAG: hypothetical protein ACLQU9_18825 [Acidimicrobiales bacterium]
MKDVGEDLHTDRAPHPGVGHVGDEGAQVEVTFSRQPRPDRIDLRDGEPVVVEHRDEVAITEA